MTYENILYEIQGKVAVITLNRPERLNALSGGLLRDLYQALKQADEDSQVGAILITGAGRGFSSGADLADPNDMPFDSQGKVDLGKALEERYNPLVKHMRGMAKPVIGAVNGIAAGAGCSLALGCDLTLAARSASFLLAFVNIGLMPDAGATWFLPQRIGSQRALGMSLLGEKLPAEEARNWGLIWDVVDDESLLETALQMAQKLANGPAQSIRRIKQATYAADDNDLPTQLDLERDLQRECGVTNDFAEGVSAFMQKRPAQFKGQ